MSKLWIFGDSFTGSASINNPPAWTQILCDKFINKNYHVSSKASRDFQTILDIFLRNLNNISKDDFVIIVVPSLQRARLPLETPEFDYEHYSEVSYEKLKKNLDYFIGESSYVKDNFKLESPLTDMDDDFIKKSLDMERIINASEASKKNYLEVIKSLKSYLPFQIYLWSWTNEIDSPLVENRFKIEKEIGYWHTLRDLYTETNGLEGNWTDSHFSPKMHKAFADYLIVKFPQFFNL